jgi:hypothetical protein
MTITATSRLAEVTLSPAHAQMLEGAQAGARGPEPWKARKRSEARQLLALAQLAGGNRMQVLGLDLSEDLRAAIRLDAPVALRPGPDGALNVARGAVIGLVYPRTILAAPQPGTSLLCLLLPARGAWYPNIAAFVGQPMCLGTFLPSGIPAHELVLLGWGLLTLQNVMLDAGDAAGVMNLSAAEWWMANRNLMPLTREPFLASRGGAEEEPC